MARTRVALLFGRGQRLLPPPARGRLLDRLCPGGRRVPPRLATRRRATPAQLAVRAGSGRVPREARPAAGSIHAATPRRTRDRQAGAPPHAPRAPAPADPPPGPPP